jgi:lysyl-tRNA synthetase class 1
MDDKLIVPLTIEDVIQRFDNSEKTFTEFDVSAELAAARNALDEPSEAENAGAWSECLAFALTKGPHHENPWNTFFGPLSSARSNDGQVVYYPDIGGTPPEAVSHWKYRARSISNPLLKSRYADLAWDMSQVIGKKKRDPEDARLAIDAYLASLPLHQESYERFHATVRALDLASLIADNFRTDAARGALMKLHRDAVSSGKGQWWFAVDRLLEDRKAGVTEPERAELVDSLETLMLRFTDQSNPELDPHSAQDAAERLTKYYSRTQKPADVKRLQAMVGKTFEHAASLASAMLGSAFLQTAMDRYRDAGMPDDSRRVRILMQKKIEQANAEMVPIGTELKITFDDMEKFLSLIVTDDIGESLLRIAREFQLKRKSLEAAVQKTLKQSPLMAHIPHKIMAGDYVAATIGSVQDDPFGRLFHEAKLRFAFFGPWLHEAFDRLREKHDLDPEHIAGWANRHSLFEDAGLLREGVRAWFQGDFAKATHILVPQVEVALRSIAHQAGVPVTKAHPKVPETSVAIGMGDILYTNRVTDVLGANTSLHFQALFADPRGLNLRNEMAHGLLGASAFDGHTARLLIHTLLILGLWKELAGKG